MQNEGNAKVKLSCRQVWKVHGDGAKQFLKGHENRPDTQAHADAGLIAKV